MHRNAHIILAVGLILAALMSCSSRPAEPNPGVELSSDGLFRPAIPAAWIVTSSLHDFGRWDYNWWMNTQPSPAMIQKVKEALVEKIKNEKNPDFLTPFLIYANGVEMVKDRSVHEIIRDVIKRVNAISKNEKWELLDGPDRPDGPWISNSIARP